MFKTEKQIRKIITHGGQAHLDDFLAVGLARTLWPVPVERRNPSVKELEDNSILILDIGNKYEPEKMNFDHHQDKDLPAAIILFSKWIINNIIKEEYKPFIEKELFSPNRITNRIFLEDVSTLDTKGPTYCNKNGIPLPDPLTLTAVRKFQTSLAETYFTDVFDKARKAIKIINQVLGKKSYNQNKLFIIEHCDNFTPWEIIEVAESYYNWEKHTPPIVIFPDDRGEGWGVLRRNDAPGVDFSTLKDHPEVLFAHPNGFIFKTHRRIPIEKLIDLLKGII